MLVGIVAVAGAVVWAGGGGWFFLAASSESHAGSWPCSSVLRAFACCFCFYFWGPVCRVAGPDIVGALVGICPAAAGLAGGCL